MMGDVQFELSDQMETPHGISGHFAGVIIQNVS
jgi:hypothetical protein